MVFFLLDISKIKADDAFIGLGLDSVDILDLHGHDAWKKLPKIFSQMVVKDGDESHGTSWAPTSYKVINGLITPIRRVQEKIPIYKAAYRGYNSIYNW